MRDDYTEWERFTHPDPDEEDPPTLDEIQTLREFCERYGTPNAIPANDAARDIMSLADEDHVVDERQNPVVDKGERVSWLLWDAGIEMTRYQPAILRLVEAIRALPELDRTEEQIRTGRFDDKLERWRNLEKFENIWWYEFHNANVFYAHHLSIYPPDSPNSNELTAAFRIIIFALEQDPWNYSRPVQPPSPTYLKRHIPRDLRSGPDHIQMLNTDVHLMVPYFEIAGHIIFEFVGKRDLSLLATIKSTKCDLWKGDSMFTMERWEFWKDRLRWVSEQDELLERTRDDARNLIQLMQGIEQQKLEKELGGQVLA
ncbi:hypothetical protein DTO166G4_3762 [Paecilomyces variotii]|nr:hypothetical protein DTO166G4_3762 [Paecilomyces variotii]KAJ9224288.1 hypothetical protein DTO169C6_3393 [Paecilomyces variotii]KAJ9232593.1 hypothetical protein DTO166G5_6189 [Paecilomyces variotii]KAJ9284915.1 hypothetical protein DTO021C3_7548 [Paecilomyces variotii]KAJ9394789.1 hypothetical protein DTO282F9_8263 [Paecilomyces variotii]